MKLNLNKKAMAIALSLALATGFTATAFPTLNIIAGGFASNPAVVQGHAIPNTDAVNISGNTVTVALEGTGISDAVKASTSVTITNNAGYAIVTAPALTWTGSTGAWTRFSFQLPANWQTLFHNSEQMGVKVSSTVGTTTFNAIAHKIVNNDTEIRLEIPAAGATTLSAKVTGGSLYSNTVAQSLNDYTYEYTVAPQVSGSITAADANAIFNASSNIVALSNATATPDASGNFTLTLPAGKSVQNLGANDAIFVRRKAKNSNAQYIFIIDRVTTTTTTTTTPAAPAVATPSVPRATSSTATIKPATPSNPIVATGSNSKRSSGGSSSGGGSGRRSSSSNNYTATTPSQTPAAPSVTPAAQNTAGDASKVPSPTGPSTRKNTRGKIRVPKTADAADMTESVMMLLGSFVAMGLVASATKKKED